MLIPTCHLDCCRYYAIHQLQQDVYEIALPYMVGYLLDNVRRYRLLHISVGFLMVPHVLLRVLWFVRRHEEEDS